MRPQNERSRNLIFIAPILFVLGLTGCGSGGGDNGGGSPPGTATIGPAGGTMISTDKKVVVTIPAGALGNTETITIESVDPATLPAEFSGVNALAAYKLGPDGTQFSQPIEIKATLDEQPVQADGSLTGTAALLVTSSNGVLEVLEEPNIILDGSTNTTTVIGKLRHFSSLVMTRINTAQGNFGPLDLPAVTVTTLPNALDLQTPVNFSVKVDRGTTGTEGTAYFNNILFPPPNPLQFTIDSSFGSNDNRVGTFIPGGTETTIERQVGTYKCTSSGNGITQPEVVFVTPAIVFDENLSPRNLILSVFFKNLFNVQCTDSPPTVTKVTPEDKTTSIPVTTSVKVEFSRPVDSQSINNTTFQLLDKQAKEVAGSIFVDQFGLYATFTPTNPLDANSEYLVVVTTGAKSAAGIPLGKDFTSTFTTGGGAIDKRNSFNFMGTGGELNGRIIDTALTCMTYSPVGDILPVACDNSPLDTVGFSYNLKGGILDSFHVYVIVDGIAHFAIVVCNTGSCANTIGSPTKLLAISQPVTLNRQETGAVSTGELNIDLSLFSSLP